mgnify:CR=1 FL=1
MKSEAGKVKLACFFFIEIYIKAKAFLENKGYEVDRSFFGSDDGEAILYRKRGAEDGHFLCHLDPLFVEGEDVEGYVKEEIQSLSH